MVGGSRLPASQHHRPGCPDLPGHPLPPQPGPLQQAGGPGQPRVLQHPLAGLPVLLRVAPHLSRHHLRLQEEIHPAGGGGGGSVSC